MKVSRKYILIALVIAVTLCALLLVYACNDETTSAPTSEEIIDTPAEETPATENVTDDPKENQTKPSASEEGNTSLFDDEQTVNGGNEEMSDGEQSSSEEQSSTDTFSVGEYIRIESVEEESVWSVYVGETSFGNATVKGNGTLEIEAFTSGSIELWAKADEDLHVKFYLRFTSLEGYREARFRSELGVVQIDLSAEDLDVIVPTGSPENGSDNGESSEETPCCALCGASLSESGAHESTCSHFAIIPAESEARDFLSALPGMREDLTVSAMSAETELYSFVLNYLSEASVETLTTLLTENGANVIPRGNGNTEYRIQKRLGSKVFIIVINVENGTSKSRAAVNLSGVLPEE